MTQYYLPRTNGWGQQTYPYYPQNQVQFPQQQVPQQQFTQQQVPQTPQFDAPSQQTLPLIEQSYIENILRLNRGKEATVYMNFETGDQSGIKIFKGVIEAAGKDHIILSDPETGKRYLLLTIYLNYITFDEEINYFYPFTGISNIIQPGQQRKKETKKVTKK